jgi:hypothetical protein
MNELYLILHRVRGEPAFDIASRLDIGSAGGWIIPTSGHRAYPYRWWSLEDLVDGSDINMSGFHDRPASFDHTIPDNWPDHYQIEEPKKPPVKLNLYKEDYDRIERLYNDKALIESIVKQITEESQS